MEGRRLPDGFRLQEAEPGDYWRQWEGLRSEPVKPGYWAICAPDGSICALKENHSVVEREDGRITVTPSIVTSTWHGFLVDGVWSGT